MTMRPCLDCGTPSEGPRCPEHATEAKGTRHARGYDAAWTRLSKRARRLQPFCSDCGSTEDLQTDHTPEAWAAKAQGKPIKLSMVDVVCGPCNRARGAARGPSTRGQAPSGDHPGPRPRQSLNLTPRTDSFDEFDGLPLCRGVVDSADSGSLFAVEDLEGGAGKVECNGVLVLPSLPIGECDPESRLGHVGSVP